MDLLSSGPERPQRASRVWRRRGVRVAAAVLVAAAVAVPLARSTPDPSPSEVDRRAASAAAAVPVPPLPSPPFDRLPGRVAIPAPARTGGQLSGPLPPTGRPDRTAAARALGLVLGRFCVDPDAYAYTLGPEGIWPAEDWRHVTVLLFKLERGGTAPSLQLRLDWTGRAYRWSGPAELSNGC